MIQPEPIGLVNTGMPVMTLLIVGVLIFAAVHTMRGNDVIGAISTDTMLTLGYLGWLSAKAALIWGPVLALVWFSLAQHVEKRRGEDVARRGGA
jgi:hypothetical protein